MNAIERIVDVAWLRDHGDDHHLVVIDARPAPNYDAGHIPGARHLDTNALRLSTSDPMAIATFHQHATAEIRRLGIEPGDHIVFYEDFSGSYAARGVWLFHYVGLANAAILDGGLTAWIQAGGEIEQHARPVTASQFEIHPNPALLATAGELLTWLADPKSGLRVIDTRSDLEFMTGTIPTALHLEWTRTLDDSGKFRPLPEIRELFAAHGLQPDTGEPIVTFCGSGFRAAHTYLLLDALGFGAVKNYVPSWREWGAGGLPIERPRR